MWCYHSEICVMRIFLNGKDYSLEIGDTVYGTYSNPVLAADDVASFVTGCYEWDSIETHINNYPKDLSEWERMK